MTRFLQTLLDSITVGSLYALIALGYTMVYGVLRFINFAHGDVVMSGAWLALVTAITAGVSGAGQAAIPPRSWEWWLIAAAAVTLAARLTPWWRSMRRRLGPYAEGPDVACVILVSLALFRLVIWGGTAATAALWPAPGQAGGPLPWGSVLPAGVLLLTSMTLCAILGFNIERLAYRPLRHAPRLNVLITAIGVSLLIQNIGQLPGVFGSEPATMPPVLPDQVLFSVAGVKLRSLDVLVIAMTVGLMAGLDHLVFRTRLGLAMRAVSFDRDLAALLGVPAERIVSLTFVLGSTLAAAAGFLYAANPRYATLQQPADASWTLLGLKAFVAAVVGGIGDIRGAMLGGLLIGVLEMFGAAYISPQLRDVYVFVLLILVLLLRPTGIRGRVAMEKV